MKLLHINTLFAPRRFGGAEVFLERLSTELVARGQQVLVASLSPSPERHGNDDLQVHEFQLRNIYWPFDGSRRSPWRKVIWHLRNSFGRGGAADIDQLLREERPDVVHTHNLAGWTSAVWRTVHSHRIPLVHTIHDYALLCPSATMFRRQSNCGTQCAGCRFLSRANRQNSRFVDVVVGVSEFTLNQHLRHGYFPRAEKHVVLNGNPVDAPPARARRTLPAVPKVGYLGRLAPSKGIEIMLDALAPLVPQKCEVLVAGAGATRYEADLKSRYEPLGMSFLGRVDSAKFLSSIDLLVAPSLWHEPFGLVLCEAMSAGLPVVASAAGGIPEFVEHGECGLLFPPGDRGALRDSVVRVLGDPDLYESMSRHCLEKATTFEFARTAENYQGVYDQIHAGAGRDVVYSH